MKIRDTQCVMTGMKLALAAALTFAAASCGSLHGDSAVAAEVGKPGAQGYYRWLRGCLDGLEKDLPAIGAAAEKAAGAYGQEGWEIGVYADRDIVGEFNGRAGGMMRMTGMKAMEKPEWKGIVLFFPREKSLQEDLATAEKFCKERKMVVGFGGAAVREAGKKAGVEWSSFVDTHAALHGGLFPAKGGWVVPTDPPANIAAGWTWTGEFVGALTRRGKMPPFYQSISVPGSEQRNKRHETLKFEEGAPQPVAAGALGRDYLTQVGASLALLHRQDLGNLVKVAEQAVAVRRAGKQAHVFAHGHALDQDIGIAHDPGYLHQVNRGLFSLIENPGISQGDFVFCIGYDRIFQGWYFHDDLDKMRAAGPTFAWSMTDYNKDPASGPAAVPAGEIIIWQHWALGDAVVSVPGYDIKILPPSGVIAEAVLWMTEAEMLGILGADSAAVAP